MHVAQREREKGKHLSPACFQKGFIEGKPSITGNAAGEPVNRDGLSVTEDYFFPPPAFGHK